MCATTVANHDLPNVRSGVAAYTPGFVWFSLLGLACLVQGAGSSRLTPSMVGGLATGAVLQLVAAASFHPFLKLARRVRLFGLIPAAGVVILAPLVIQEEAGTLRFITACASVIVIMKLWDVHMHADRDEAISWKRFTTFFVNLFSVVLRKEGEEVQPPRAVVLRDLARGTVGSLIGIVAIFTLRLIPWREYPLIIEHAVKASVIFVAILSWFRAGIAVVRLSGGVMREFSTAPLAARTPADFWRRYNRVFNQYFVENVFKPAGGRRSPARVVMLVFLCSALIHEYVFGIAIGRVQGFQTAFFLLQGIAVAATMRIRPAGRVEVIAWTSATLAFNLITSIFFFLSFHAIVRLYANPLPLWLQR